MKLYLVQHGEALPKETEPERPLSERGRNDVRKLAGFLSESGVRVERVFHSGKTRARQTAELLAAEIAPGAEVEESLGLDPNDPTDAFALEVARWSEDALVVGHLPFMARLVSRLVTREETPYLAAYRPGSVVCVERAEDGSWVILWMLRPELMA